MDYRSKRMRSFINIKDYLNESIDISKLSERDQWRVKHARMLQKHKGHESMHLEMMLILITCLVVAQLLLAYWKQKYFKSYQIATLGFMWVIPVATCFYFHWWRFIFIWLTYSIVTACIMYRATRKPVEPHIPRLVFKYFVGNYKVSCTVGLIGYACVMGTLLGLNVLLMIKPQTGMDVGLQLIFYGLYFGVVGRDFAEVSTDRMATHIGYYRADGVPTRHLEPRVCAVCAQSIDLHVDGDELPIEKTYRLSCNHLFHEFCIKGWIMVGKKQTCPYCKEKVDLKRMFSSPWARTDLLYGNVLDAIRYLVAWQPLVIMLVQGINWELGLE